MATVTGFTSARMLDIENNTVVDGNISGDDLILVTYGGSNINAGNVRGPVGPAGPFVGDMGDVGDVDVTGVEDGDVLAWDLASSTWVPVSAFANNTGIYNFDAADGATLPIIQLRNNDIVHGFMGYSDALSQPEGVLSIHNLTTQPLWVASASYVVQRLHTTSALDGPYLEFDRDGTLRGSIGFDSVGDFSFNLIDTAKEIRLRLNGGTKLEAAQDTVTVYPEFVMLDRDIHFKYDADGENLATRLFFGLDKADDDYIAFAKSGANVSWSFYEAGNTVGSILNAGSFNATSTRAVKEDIRPLTDDFDIDDVVRRFKLVEPQLFRKIGKNETDVGFVAEDWIENGFAEVSNNIPDVGPGLDALGISAIQQGIIQNLLERVEALEAAQA